MERNVQAPLYLPLESADATLELVGGKGASLARMAVAGLPVPRGFHLTTAAYRRFVEANSLYEAIVAAVASAVVDDPVSLERASATIRSLFDRGSMPEDVATAIRQAYASLGQPAVAVRSSATAEDLPGMSFAGQQDTYLNVYGEDALLDAVRRCWASLWTARAIGYRLKMGVDQRSVSMAVVVQTMVPSEVSGVLFTSNPTTGDRDELVVNASFGLGEAVVSGQVTPDSFLLDKGNLAVKERVLGTKEAEVLPSEGQGTTTREVPEERRGEASLSEVQLRELGELALQVEHLFDGVPQDIEWALSEGRVWLLQSRPITSLPLAPLKNVTWEPPIPGTKWVRRQVAENMPEPLSPLFEELYLREGLEISMAKVIAKAGKSDVVSEADRPWYTTVNGYAYLRGNFTMNWKIVRNMVVVMARGTIIRAIFQHGVPYWRDEILPAHQATVERWKEFDPTSASDEQLLDGIRELARAEAMYWGGTNFIIAVTRASDIALNRFLNGAMRGSGLSSALFLRGFPTKAMEAEAELQSIAEKVRDSEELRELVASTPVWRLMEALGSSHTGRPVQEKVQLYLERYGHQVYTLDFVTPTQAEDPTPVLLSLKAKVTQPGQDVRERQAEMAQERDRLVQRTASSLDPVRRRLFLKIVRWAQDFAPFREEAFFYVGSAWPPLRRLALELGRRLAGVGSLDNPDDVFFLESTELIEASQARAASQGRSDLARLARERRELREARKRLHPPAAVPPSAGIKFGPIDLSFLETQKRNLNEGSILKGFPVSPGRVTAHASVILSPADFDRMVPDTILVCPTTTPAWTPLFAQARGLVTDIGGVTAHGSIVAREYGIPAVMGTGNGTRRIANGQSVTVDGDAGTVALEGDERVAGSPLLEEMPPSRSLTVRRGWLALAAVLLTALIWLRRRSRRSTASR